jgi:hypothetical protein
MSDRELVYTIDTDLTTLHKVEGAGLQLLADGVNMLAYHHRRKVRRRIGRPYRLTLRFRWTRNGEIEVEELRLREERR